jgi:hypothetical protein
VNRYDGFANATVSVSQDFLGCRLKMTFTWRWCLLGYDTGSAFDTHVKACADLLGADRWRMRDGLGGNSCLSASIGFICFQEMHQALHNSPLRFFRARAAARAGAQKPLLLTGPRRVAAKKRYRTTTDRRVFCLVWPPISLRRSTP